MRLAFLIGLLAAALSTPAWAAREARSISFPAVSSDGQTVYFSCWGDIWSAPRDGSAPARRLTDNVAFDSRPTLSPDGKWIAFLSDRFGNYDLFLMPAEGGEARRLTWDSNTDYPYDWKPDSSAVLMYGQRQDLWANAAYEVPLDGGEPKRITGPDHDDHVFVSYLGDPAHLVYTRGPGDWARKEFHGQGNYDLWTYDTATGHHEALTDWEGKDLWPQPSPDGASVYFVSDRDGTENIWELALDSGEFRQLTHFENSATRWPRISADGDEIACEVFGELFIVSTKRGDAERVSVQFADDPKHVMTLETDFANRIGEYALSPNGNYYAVTVLGDVFILKNPETYEDDAEPDQDLSRTRPVVTGPGREMHLNWHPESTKLTYVSDREGQFEVYVLDLVTLEERRLTSTSVDEAYPEFAPKGERLSYYSGNRRLMLYDLEKEEQSLLYEGMIKGGPWHLGYAWAPDGYWLAIEEQVNDIFTEIFILNIEELQPVNISVSPDWNSGIAWSPDGKYLAFAQTNPYVGGGDVLLLELDPEPETYDTKLLFPQDIPGEEPDETPEGEDQDETTVSEDEKSRAEGTDIAPDEAEKEETIVDKEEEELEPLSIDLERIHLRAERLTAFEGSAYDPLFSPDSKFLIFISEHEGSPEWWSITLEERELSQLASAEEKEAPQFAPDGTRLYFLENERVTYLDISGASAAGGGMVAMTSRLDYDQYLLWEQMLAEGWRILNTSFYDEDLLGIDWAGIRERYMPRVRECATPYEYGSLYREMLGELGASHLGYYGFGDETEVQPDTTADFGVLYDEQYQGAGWRIARVINDGPADQPGSRLYPGDEILEVNGTPVGAGQNRARLLRNLAHQPVTLTVESGDTALMELAKEQPESEGSEAEKEPPQPSSEPETRREVVIVPTSHPAMNSLLYEQWVEDNREVVSKASEGHVGYQHIRGMNTAAVERFRRELFTETQGKEALIIDIRFNGGGNTAVDIMNLVDHRPAYLRRHRDSDATFVARQLTWEGPIVVLINAHCFSNAEIFAHIMKDLGLATLIGETTPGGVISTYQFTLVDGSGLAVPAWGNYRLTGEDMEGGGAIPDVFIHIDPEVVAEGGDNQLTAAVDFLLQQLE